MTAFPNEQKHMETRRRRLSLWPFLKKSNFQEHVSPAMSARWRDGLDTPQEDEALTYERRQCAEHSLAAIDKALAAAHHIRALLLGLEQVIDGANETKEPEEIAALTILFNKFHNEIDRHALGEERESGPHLINGRQTSPSFLKELEYHSGLILTQADLTTGPEGLGLPIIHDQLNHLRELEKLRSLLKSADAHVKQIEGNLMSDSILIHHRFASVLVAQI